jgi:hypothetical protein
MRPPRQPLPPLRALIPLAGSLLAAFPAMAEDLRIGSQYSYSHPTFVLETGAESGRVEFAPRVSAQPGFEANYRGFGFATSLPLPDFSGHAFSGEGNGQGLNDFRAHWHGDDWGVEAYHRYANNFEAMPELPAGGPVTPRPDVTLRLTDVTVYRSLDPDSKVYRLSEGLDATGGEADFFLMLSASNARLRGDAPFVPGLAATDSRFAGVKAIDVSALGVGGGYSLSGNLAGLYIEQALFAGYGPQYRVFGDEADWAWNLVKVNVRFRMGLRTRWFDAGAGFENDAQAVFAGDDRLLAHALVARAGLEVFL